MLRRRRDPINRLRSAIECLPADTRQAMLAGIRAQETIIAGAYADRAGGVCPMLAAHRHGSRVDLLAFARAWDAYARVKRPRPATPRELRTLVSLLERTLDDPPRSSLAAAIAEHERSRSHDPPPSPGSDPEAVPRRGTGSVPKGTVSGALEALERHIAGREAAVERPGERGNGRGNGVRPRRSGEDRGESDPGFVARRLGSAAADENRRAPSGG